MPAYYFKYLLNCRKSYCPNEQNSMSQQQSIQQPDPITVVSATPLARGCLLPAMSYILPATQILPPAFGHIKSSQLTTINALLLFVSIMLPFSTCPAVHNDSSNNQICPAGVDYSVFLNYLCFANVNLSVITPPTEHFTRHYTAT